jgi:hypothetical protein
VRCLPSGELPASLPSTVGGRRRPASTALRTTRERFLLKPFNTSKPRPAPRWADSALPYATCAAPTGDSPERGTPQVRGRRPLQLFGAERRATAMATRRLWLDPSELRSLGEELNGPRWQTKLAQALPFSTRTIRYALWRAGNPPCDRGAAQGTRRRLGGASLMLPDREPDVIWTAGTAISGTFSGTVHRASDCRIGSYSCVFLHRPERIVQEGNRLNSLFYKAYGKPAFPGACLYSRFFPRFRLFPALFRHVTGTGRGTPAGPRLTTRSYSQAESATPLLSRRAKENHGSNRLERVALQERVTRPPHEDRPWRSTLSPGFWTAYVNPR